MFRLSIFFNFFGYIFLIFAFICILVYAFAYTSLGELIPQEANKTHIEYRFPVMYIHT